MATEVITPVRQRPVAVPRKTLRKKPGKILTHVAIIAGILVVLYPLLWMVSAAFKPSDEIFTTGLWPKTWSFDSFIKGWAGVSGHSFTQFYVNSFVMVAFAIIGNVVSCSLTAYAFARFSFRGKTLLFGSMLLTLMIPVHALVIPQYLLFNQLGWIDSILPIVVPKFFGVDAFFIFLMVQYIRSLPVDLDEAARIDGCNRLQVFLRIILPLMKSPIITTVIFTFVWTWNDFFSQLLYLSSVKNYTVTLALRMFMDSEGESGLGSMLAMSALSLVPIFAVFLFFQKYIVGGLATSGLK
jgi:multiple sugar transport system permease protein